MQIVNESAELADVLGSRITAALQHQVDHDFRPTWGVAAELEYVARDDKPDPEAWWLVVLDDSDQAEALGYHDLTPKVLHPIGKAFAKTTIADGAELSVTIGHELLEMLGNPYLGDCVIDPRTGRVYAKENCDAVEADQFAYPINGILVSDFVLPQFFDPRHRGKGIPLSFKGNVHEPFEIATGGYLSYLNLDALGEGWQQALGMNSEAVETSRGVRSSGWPRGSRRDRIRRAAAGELVISEDSVCAPR